MQCTKTVKFGEYQQFLNKTNFKFRIQTKCRLEIKIVVCKIYFTVKQRNSFEMLQISQEDKSLVTNAQLQLF